MNARTLVSLNLQFIPDFSNLTSIERIQLIMNDQKYRDQAGIHLFHNLGDANPGYDSRKTHYGSVDRFNLRKKLNIFNRGERLFDSCPVIYFRDGGMEFLENFGGEATEEPSYICRVLPPNGGIPIEYWRRITDKKLKKILRN